MTVTREAPGLFRRIAAFALDYLVSAGYLVVLAIVGSALAFGPLKDEWQTLVASPARMDGLAFLTAVLPVVLYFTLLESSRAGATWGKRRMGLRVIRMGGGRLNRRRALVRSLVKFLPWQLAHTCLFHIPGWPVEPQEPPAWVMAGLVLAMAAVGFCLVTLAVGPTRRAPHDWVAGSRVVRRSAKLAG